MITVLFILSIGAVVAAIGRIIEERKRHQRIFREEEKRERERARRQS